MFEAMSTFQVHSVELANIAKPKPRRGWIPNASCLVGSSGSIYEQTSCSPREWRRRESGLWFGAHFMQALGVSQGLVTKRADDRVGEIEMDGFASIAREPRSAIR